ncbi:hypothetical protein B0H19DRAFT_1189128 [Mycena capillaripes]|nr:hypothetical protein B0H19DRAFT_1189128 [Mycena capillaripes]
MFATFLTLALFVASALNGVAADDDFKVDTPALTQCQPAVFTWDATTPPYNVILVRSDAPCGEIIKDLGDHTNNSITWTVDLAAGVEYSLSVEDNDGNEGWSSGMLIKNSTDASCLNNAAAAPSSAAKSSSAKSTPSPTAAVGAAGAAVTGGSDSGSGSDSDSDDGSSTGPLGAASGSGAFSLHASPIMALCALFAVALAL